jgi:hypothetical protein
MNMKQQHRNELVDSVPAELAWRMQLNRACALAKTPADSLEGKCGACYDVVGTRQSVVLTEHLGWKLLLMHHWVCSAGILMHLQPLHPSQFCASASVMLLGLRCGGCPGSGEAAITQQSTDRPCVRGSTHLL